MAAFDTGREHKRASSQLAQGVYRTTFYLGVALRRTRDFILFPYLRMAGLASRNNDRREGSGAAAAKPKRIFSRLSRINNRLRSIERSLSDSDQDGRNSIGRQARRIDELKATQKSGENLSGELVQSLSDPDPGVREIALRTLGEISGEDTVVLILEALHDIDPNVRCAAAEAAGRTGSPTAVFSLILLLNDQQEQVRHEAKAAIEAITGHRVDFVPSEKLSVRKRKIEDLQNWWKEERFVKLSGELKIALKQWKNR